MDTFVLAIHMLIAVALVLLVLVQRSEGAGLMGPSSAGMAPIRGTSNLLTRATSILAVMFFATSLTLAMLAGHRSGTGSIVDNIQVNAPAIPEPAPVTAPATPLEIAPADTTGNPTNPPVQAPVKPVTPAAPVTE